MKRDGTTWAQLALAELSPERVLMGWLGLRHRNIQEATGGRIEFLILYFD